MTAAGVEVGTEGGGETSAGVNEDVGMEPAAELASELEPEPEPEPKFATPLLNSAGTLALLEVAPPLNFPAKHCVIKGTSFPPVGVKLKTYVSSKLPAAHPTQPKKLSEFSFKKSKAAHTSVRQLWLLLPPPVSLSRA